MKKIGILTFQRASNYGAALQMYALQRKIRDIGPDAEVIDFICPYIFDWYKPFMLKHIFHPRALIGDILNASIKMKRNHQFSSFVKKTMRFSKPVSKSSLSSISDKYDVYIVGSDQVWNPLLTNSESAYFLDFVKEKSKRRSYAASFGVSEWPISSTLPIARLLEEMGAISTREEAGKKLIQSISGNTAPITVDLDPVFLLKKEEWLSIAKKKVGSKSYLFIYAVGNENLEKVYRTASQLAEEKGLYIINLRYGRSIRHSEYQIGHVVYDAGPDDFVSFIANASCVVTDSFHATAFSVIFHKPMYISMPNTSGSRISNLFSTAGIEGRSIGKMMKKIDWDKADRQMEKARRESLSHLKEIIGE
ncbi:polysaccharide pyruvyl transferase family protein [Acidaminococcus sp.]|uniref:polysaccharide pyruvyl transferase family protein n=1 Tax=Acidaminococcus sp. TaxID=1872103 RepID=UPI003520EA20